MPIVKHDEFFRSHPVFTADDLTAHLEFRGSVGPRGGEALLAHHVRAGRLIRVRRGLYAVVPPGADPTSFPVDPYLVASRLTPDAVLSHHTALEFHGRAYSAWDHLTYLAVRPSSPLSFRSHIFRGTRFPAALIRSHSTLHGVLTADRAGLPVRVTSLERTLVDVLDRPRHSGGWEEVWRSLESVEFFDIERVVDYALLLDNATTAAKVGFYLEQHGAVLMVEPAQVERLRRHRPRQPHYIDGAREGQGRIAPGWNLVVPREVLNRAWEEIS
ncbi:MAG: transcriptional regulator [Chloroflexota bacterium]|nr:transcriptional regulator [Chloroflexota bacterium]